MVRNTILLFGGDSNERLVSVASAMAMAQALGSSKLWFWHNNGPIYEVDYDQLLAHQDPFTKDFLPHHGPLFGTVEEAISAKACEGYTFVLGVHGGKGENGYLQTLLEKCQRPFTGSNAKASITAFNKIATKECLLNYQIKMAPHLVLETTDDLRIAPLLKDFLKDHKELIIKPICGGSSLGCLVIKRLDHIDAAIAEMMKFFPEPFLAEKFIQGREFSVGAIEDDNGLIALPCTEIVLEKGRDFDYQGKYLGLGAKEITPAKLKDSTARDAQRMAIAAHAALSLDGYSRTDMILAKDGFYFLETNTLPGLTKQSIVPQQLAAAGITMRAFLETQIKLAGRRRY
jgi:D-alanine-D-alanine ligase